MERWRARVGLLAVVVVLLVAWPIPPSASIAHPGSLRAVAVVGSWLACTQRPACGSLTSHHSQARPTPSNNSSGSGGSNGTTGWVQLTVNGSTPVDRTQPSFAYDPSIGKVVMFGGYDGNANTQRGDTWTFQNGTWTDLTNSLNSSPSARWGGQMVWDPADQLLVMFGGRTQSQFLNDTWTFNGTNWTNVTNSVAPPTRAHYEMAYDPVDRYIVLTSGDVESALFTWSVYNDTWSWTNGTWANISGLVNGTLPPRIYGQAAYDPWNNSVVVVGGTATEGCVPGSPVTTYRTDQAWSYPASVGPQNVAQGMMTYDPLGPFLFAYGGELTQAAGCPQTNETWVRANGTWVNVTAVAGLPPSARYLSGIAYDAHDQEIVLFGGNSNSLYLTDTWVYRIQPVIAQITSSRAVGGAPLVATFTANASGGSEVFTYNWSFGDGNYSTRGPNVTHSFPRLGTYTVVLNVTDFLGRTGSANLTVHVVRPIAASASASATLGAVPFTVNFTISASGGLAPYTYSWNFGDGGTATGAAPGHTYTSSGNFTAVGSVQDGYGDSNRSSVLIHVAPRLAVTGRTSDTTGIVPFPVNFSATPAGGNPPYTFQWNFGDGGTATTDLAQHVFTSQGTYFPSVAVTDSLGHVARYSTTVHAYAPLSVSAQTNVSLGVLPLPVALSASSNGGDGLGNFTWNFGDGSPAQYGPSQDHVFAAPGSFSVQVTVADLNRTAMASVVVTSVAPLSLHLTAPTTTGEVGIPFRFTADLVGGSAPITVSWSFGDGVGAHGGLVQNHSYARAGSYTVTLSASDGLSERSTAYVVVGVVRALTVALTDEAPSVVLGSSDNLTGTIGGGATPYTLVWSGLPPGCRAALTQKLLCTPNATGSYTISLTVVDHLGVQSVGSVAMVVAAPAATTGPAGSGGLPPLTLVFVGVVGAVAVAVVVAVLARRRRGSGDPPAFAETGEGATDPELT